MRAGRPQRPRVPSSSVYDALRAGSSPAAVLLGADGQLAGSPVTGVEDIEELVARLAEQPDNIRRAATTAR